MEFKASLTVTLSADGKISLRALGDPLVLLGLVTRAQYVLLTQQPSEPTEPALLLAQAIMPQDIMNGR